MPDASLYERAEFDAVAAELARSLDVFKVPEPEKGEVLAAFAAEKLRQGEPSPASSREDGPQPCLDARAVVVAARAACPGRAQHALVGPDHHRARAWIEW